MLRIILLIAALHTISLPIIAQQVPDLDFETASFEARYETGDGPVIGIDGGHNNFHQLDGGFAPFGKLLSADGYNMKAIESITKGELTALDILVIANPLHESNIGNWQNPTPSAYTDTEIQIIKEWVHDGGRLLLIADHMPFGGAANKLAETFGFSYENGFVINPDQQWPPDKYSQKGGNLYPSIFTMGIDSISAFTGSALKTGKGATIIASFPETHQLLLPEVAWQFDENTPQKPLDNYAMGAAMEYGKGKTAFFTEAAMFTAQIAQGQYKVGFNAMEAPQNQNFVLNVIHWLDKNSPESIVYDNLRAMKLAFEANKMDEIAELYTSDGIIYKQSGEEVRGKASIKDYWQGLKGRAISWNSWILDVEQAGDQIVAVFRLDLSYKDYKNNEVTSPTKAILVYKKEDGEYKLFRDFYVSVKKWEKSPFDFTTTKEMEHDDFSFWIGNWKVYKTGTDTLVGMSRIEPILDGKAIRESYYSTLSGYKGTSINTYATEDKQWEQYWVDNTGTRLMLSGHYSYGKMLLSDCDHSKQEVCNLITWFKDGYTVRQIWSQSEDGGTNWNIIFDGTYKK